MKPFWIIWTFDLLGALVAGWFFCIGIMDGSVGADNIGLWLLIMAGLVAVLYGSVSLYRRCKIKPAYLLLAVLALPCLLMLFFIIMLVFSDVHWQ
jgi:ABC-type branched-subunit amino acid transport system permease subunit